MYNKYIDTAIYIRHQIYESFAKGCILKIVVGNGSSMGKCALIAKYSRYIFTLKVNDTILLCYNFYNDKIIIVLFIIILICRNRSKNYLLFFVLVRVGILLSVYERKYRLAVNLI